MAEITEITFADPTATRRRSLGGEAWIEVRSRLPYGAAERLRNVALKSMSADAGQTKIDLDMSTHNIERMLAYIVDWSARKPDGGRVAPTRDAFMALAEPAAEAINAALDRHIEELTEEARAAGGDPSERRTAPLSLSAAPLESATPSY